MTKQDVRVIIDSNKKVIKALEILKKHNEPICDSTTSMKFDGVYNNLKLGENGAWFVGKNDPGLKAVTLDELYELLSKQKD